MKKGWVIFFIVLAVILCLPAVLYYMKKRPVLEPQPIKPSKKHLGNKYQTNCSNCGGTIKNYKCEYCQTEYYKL